MSGNRLSKKIIDDRIDLQNLIDQEVKEAINGARLSANVDRLLINQPEEDADKEENENEGDREVQKENEVDAEKTRGQVEELD